MVKIQSDAVDMPVHHQKRLIVVSGDGIAAVTPFYKRGKILPGCHDVLELPAVFLFIRGIENGSAPDRKGDVVSFAEVGTDDFLRRIDVVHEILVCIAGNTLHHRKTVRQKQHVVPVSLKDPDIAGSLLFLKIYRKITDRFL